MKWIASLVLVLCLAGCGADEPDAADPTTPNTTIPTQQMPDPVPDPTTSPKAKPSLAPTSTPTSTPTPTPTQPTSVDLSGARIPQFRNGAGDITCLFEDFEGVQVRCDVLGAQWKVAKPASCRGAYGDSATLGAAPVLTCHGDTIFSPDDMLTLAPGNSVVFKSLSCTMAEASVTCRNDTGRSITVAKGSYSFS